MNAPRIYNYGNGRTNSTAVDINVRGRIRTYYFSYETVVAVCDPEFGLLVSRNEWSATTGKHLNWIDGGNKAKRLKYDLFTAAVEAIGDEDSPTRISKLITEGRGEWWA